MKSMLMSNKHIITFERKSQLLPSLISAFQQLLLLQFLSTELLTCKVTYKENHIPKGFILFSMYLSWGYIPMCWYSLVS